MERRGGIQDIIVVDLLDYGKVGFRDRREFSHDQYNLGVIRRIGSAVPDGTIHRGMGMVIPAAFMVRGIVGPGSPGGDRRLP